jgi:hypothetical protein
MHMRVSSPSTQLIKVLTPLTACCAAAVAAAAAAPGAAAAVVAAAAAAAAAATAKAVVKDFQKALTDNGWPEAVRNVVAVRQPCVTFQVRCGVESAVVLQ